MSTNPDYPLRWPQYLPYPEPLHRIRGQVPNASSVNWPQAQFAPDFLPPGSASFQPYRYPQYKAVDYAGCCASENPAKKANKKILLTFTLGLLVGMIASRSPGRVVI